MSPTLSARPAWTFAASLLAAVALLFGLQAAPQPTVAEAATATQVRTVTLTPTKISYVKKSASKTSYYKKSTMLASKSAYATYVG